MSFLCDHSSLQQGCKVVSAAEAQLSGDETLDDFVRMIRRMEKRRAKRERLPDLAPSETANENMRPLIQRVRQKIRCLQQ